MREQLIVIREHTNADSLSEVIRRALAVYDTLRKVYATGSTFVIKDEKGEGRELLIPEFPTKPPKPLD